MFDLSDLNTSQKKKEIDKENPCWNVQYIQARSASKRNVDTARYEILKVWHFQQVVLWSDFGKNYRRKKTHQKPTNETKYLQIPSRHHVLTSVVCSHSRRACAVSAGSCALRVSLSSWLEWSSRASLRSSANWTTCSGPALTGEPISYMLLENSTAAAFEPARRGGEPGQRKP